MFLGDRSVLEWVLTAWCIVGSAHPSVIIAENPKISFTVRDEISLALFPDWTNYVQFSPDGNYFSVYSERGTLETNRIEGLLRFYRSSDVRNLLKQPGGAPPSPLKVVNLPSSNEEGIISDLHWLADSSGVAFLQKAGDGSKCLVLAKLHEKSIEVLTPRTAIVEAYDISDAGHYVYTSMDSREQLRLKERMQAEHHAAEMVGTRRSLDDLIFPEVVHPSAKKILWAVVKGVRFEVKSNGVPVVPGAEFSLSPDGNFLVTTLPVSEVPLSWETLYPPPPATISANRIHAGHDGSAHQYVQIDLRTGSARSLLDAPVGADAGWYWSGSQPSWSKDGTSILLPGTFISAKNNQPSRPCVAVIDLSSHAQSCVEILKSHIQGGVEEGYHSIQSAEFIDGDPHRVMVKFRTMDYSPGTAEYLLANNEWRPFEQELAGPKYERNGIEVAFQQSFAKPPLLVASNRVASRVVWDPNPRLKNIEMGEANVYRWKDENGNTWKGGLYKPVHNTRGKFFPLVIQTHGFEEASFLPSGAYTTAYAARALAAAGFLVLQVEPSPGCLAVIITPQEGPCFASGFKAAVSQLVSEGLVDPDKIGIIGFSRSCFHVMETLTKAPSYLHIKAASITDGVMENYLQYMLWGGESETDPMIGAKPFGEGLQLWLTRSPGFNLDKVTAALLVVAAGPSDVPFMWEPYAALHHLKRPVDLVMLNTDEHVITNPAERMASQGGSVDWFRFWLQGYEDPDPNKADQYKRWRGLKQMQDANDAKEHAVKN